ncbi:MAG TPA: EAL domain-containing protein [Rhodocyclaceae bacterium]
MDPNAVLDSDKLKWVTQAFANSQNGIVITDADGLVVDVNPTFCAITGYSREEVLGRNPRILHSGLHDDAFYASMWHSLTEEGTWQGEVCNRRKDGEIVVELLSIHAVKDTAGRTTHYVGNFSNLTHFKTYQAQLEQMAHFDALTQLPNRVLLRDRIRQSIAWVQRQGTLTAVCYLDLDDFKPINDRYGHQVGDQVLIEIAERIKSAIREGDTVARIGGDEFVALLNDVDSVEEVAQILGRLQTIVGTPLKATDDHGVSVSIGVTLYPIDSCDPDQLLHHADQAMYLAKQGGKGAWHIYDPGQDNPARDHYEVVSTLRQALNNDEFQLFYQPIVDMSQSQIEGFEALIRWRHPERGLLLPDEFLPGQRPGLEHSALAIELDLWSIEAALKQMTAWDKHALHLPVSVNISMRLLQWPEFVPRLTELLQIYPAVARFGVDLEIIETAALEDLALTSRTIEDCRKLGVGFCLDDFGTGYSSLSYLKRLPAQTLKIDASFVSGMLADPGDMAVVESIIGLAKAFHRRVVAVGVETDGQAHALLQRGCRSAQGFAIACPMPAERIPVWLDQLQFKLDGQRTQ